MLEKVITSYSYCAWFILCSVFKYVNLQTLLKKKNINSTVTKNLLTTVIKFRTNFKEDDCKTLVNFTKRLDAKTLF